MCHSTIPLCGAKICFLQGATHAQLIQGAQEASDGKVTGRFFHLHPRRLLRLVPWLAGWIRKGAVPVATMNMQVAVPVGEEVPDAWHHQLIFGVAQNAIFMTNPLDVGKRRGVNRIKKKKTRTSILPCLTLFGIKLLDQ